MQTEVELSVRLKVKRAPGVSIDEAIEEMLMLVSSSNQDIEFDDPELIDWCETGGPKDEPEC